MNKDHILEQMTFSPETGSLLFNGVRYLIIRPETLCAVQKIAEEEFGAAGTAILFKSALTGGRLSMEKYREIFCLSNQEAAAYMCEMGGQIGWGKLFLELFDEDSQRIVVTVRHSPFAAAYGRSHKPACHFIRGIVAGIAEAVFHHPTEVTETLCSACGDPYCRFETS
jgi:hypothetical protein